MKRRSIAVFSKSFEQARVAKRSYRAGFAPLGQTPEYPRVHHSQRSIGQFATRVRPILIAPTPKMHAAKIVNNSIAIYYVATMYETVQRNIVTHQ
jgi:hypothetical protein